MTREENIRAILECNFAGYKEEIIENAMKRICELDQEPKIIETIDFAINASGGDTNYFVGFRNGTRYVKSLIDGKEHQFESCVEQEPKTEWIPVNEKLPKEFESVLVCYKSQGGMAQCVAERLVNMDGSNRWSAMYGQEPIAWMLLPEPYKECEGEE